MSGERDKATIERHKARGIQFSKRAALLAMASVAGVLVVLIVVYSGFRAAIRETLVFSHAGWTYRATVERFTTASILRTELQWDGSDIPDYLLVDRANLHTPLGMFSVVDDRWFLDATTSAWWNPGYQPLRFPEGQPWVRQINHRSSVDEFLDLGYYETSMLGIQTNGPWTDRQLTGTPPEWVYAFKQSEGSYRGYWVDPKKLGQLPWD